MRGTNKVEDAYLLTMLSAPANDDALPTTALCKDTLVLAIVGCMVLAAHFAMGNG